MMRRFRKWLKNWLLDDDTNPVIDVIINGRSRRLRVIGVSGADLLCEDTVARDDGAIFRSIRVVSVSNAEDPERFDTLHRRCFDQRACWEDGTPLT